MATKIVIDGNKVSCVYDDRLILLLEALGDVSIKRASNVEFNSTRHLWEAELVDSGEVIASGRNRNEVIKNEVKVLEDRLQGRVSISATR
jgi:hypothetical protein